jgi:hypothetical protein
VATVALAAAQVVVEIQAAMVEMELFFYIIKEEING